MSNDVIGYLIAGAIICFGVIHHYLAWRNRAARPVAQPASGHRQHE